MTLIVFPKQRAATGQRREFLKREELQRIAPTIQKIVERSYETHPMRHRTAAETKRRVACCVTWYWKFRNIQKWPELRALSTLRLPLNAMLNGETWSPPANLLYVPDPLVEQAEERVLTPEQAAREAQAFAAVEQELKSRNDAA